ncbi:MAG: hypothetical protein ABGW69_02185 [Nanoarchaeota archaeon]
MEPQINNNNEEKPKFYYTKLEEESPIKPMYRDSWDRKIPFEQLSRKLIEDFNSVISEFYRRKSKKNISKQLVYYAIALLHLYNGTRISEAVEAFKKWLVKNENEIEVRVRKRKEGVFRIVLVPDILKFNRAIIERAISYGFNNNLDLITTRNVKKWFSTWLNINSHTCRKAWESFAARTTKGDVTKITSWQGRKRVDSHLVYLRREEFKEEFKKILDYYFKI